MPEQIPPVGTEKGTPGSDEPTKDEKAVMDNQEAEAREYQDEGSAGRKPGEADAPVIPKSAEPNFEKK